MCREALESTRPGGHRGELRGSETVPAAHAPAAGDTVRGSKFEYGFSGGSMKRLRFAAMLAAACAGLIGLSACGGSSNQISVVLATANGLTMMDETLPAPSTPSTLNIMASVGGDTTGKGGMWLVH